MKFGNEAYAKAFAHDKEDNFFTKPIGVHLGIYGAGMVNGLVIGAFDANYGDLFEKVDITNKFGQAGIELVVRGVGFMGEFTGTSYAKYGKIKWDGLGRKSANSSFKNVGYILTTYFK